jgi:hypothetical protein
LRTRDGDGKRTCKVIRTIKQQKYREMLKAYGKKRVKEIYGHEEKTAA